MKWIIVVTLPSGGKWALSVYEGQFAMVPVEENGVVKKALVWPSLAEAKDHLEKQLAIAPELKKMGEFSFKQMIDAADLPPLTNMVQ